MFKRFFFLLTLCCLANFAFAKQYICATNNGVAYPDDRTVLKCSGGLGENVKLSSLLDKGYKITTITQSVMATYVQSNGEIRSSSFWLIVFDK